MHPSEVNPIQISTALTHEFKIKGGNCKTFSYMALPQPKVGISHLEEQLSLVSICIKNVGIRDAHSIYSMHQIRITYQTEEPAR
jgi:hypothetical protein